MSAPVKTETTAAVAPLPAAPRGIVSRTQLTLAAVALLGLC